MFYLNPKIYVVCLAAYNSGCIHGVWIDADQDKDSLMAKIQTMLASSPVANATGWAVRGIEDFGKLNLPERPDLETISRLAKFLVKYGELGAALLSYTEMNIEEAECMMDRHYHGAYSSEEEFVRCHLEETEDVPESLASYIDYKEMTRDWFMDGFLSLKVGREVHVFCLY